MYEDTVLGLVLNVISEVQTQNWMQPCHCDLANSNWSVKSSLCGTVLNTLHSSVLLPPALLLLSNKKVFFLYLVLHLSVLQEVNILFLLINEYNFIGKMIDLYIRNPQKFLLHTVGLVYFCNSLCLKKSERNYK